MKTMANNFKSDLDKLKTFIQETKGLDAAIKAAQLSGVAGPVDANNKRYRLPYSSDPQPIGERWKY